jgi:predicted transcriptional regulator
MHHEPNPPGDRMAPECIERLVLTLLLGPRSHGPWTAEELGRELGDEVAAVDAVVSLHAAGLVHRCRQLVFPSRSAARCFELVEAA